MVSVKALAGSTPLAWVNVATVALLRPFVVVVIGAETTMAGSATDVLATALLLAAMGSAEVAVTEAELVRGPSSSAWALTVTVALLPKLIASSITVTTLLVWLIDPLL